MGRGGLKETGQSVQTRHAFLPCGKQYNGKACTVDKLVALHNKVLTHFESMKNNILSQDFRLLYSGLNRVLRTTFPVRFRGFN